MHRGNDPRAKLGRTLNMEYINEVYQWRNGSLPACMKTKTTEGRWTGEPIQPTGLRSNRFGESLFQL